MVSSCFTMCVLKDLTRDLNPKFNRSSGGHSTHSAIEIPALVWQSISSSFDCFHLKAAAVYFRAAGQDISDNVLFPLKESNKQIQTNTHTNQLSNQTEESSTGQAVKSIISGFLFEKSLDEAQ